MKTHGGQLFAEGGDGSTGEFVGGLLGDAEGSSDFAI